MTRIRFFAGIFVVLLFLSLGIVMAGNTFYLYSDIASLILGIILPYILVSLIYSPKEQILFCREIFRQSHEGEKGILKQSIQYFDSFKKILIYSAIVWTIVGAISIGVHLESPETLGVNFGVLMIIPLYVSIVLFIIIEPLRASAKKKLAVM